MEPTRSDVRYRIKDAADRKINSGGFGYLNEISYF